jgi:predicted HTH transcriptional regulator
MDLALKHRLLYGGNNLLDKQLGQKKDEPTAKAEQPAPDLFNSGHIQSEARHNTKTINAALTQTEVIFNALRVNGSMSQREIAMATGIEKNLISDRCKKLMEKNRIEINGTKVCQFTGMKVLTYGVRRGY